MNSLRNNFDAVLLWNLRVNLDLNLRGQLSDPYGNIYNNLRDNLLTYDRGRSMERHE